MSVRFFKIFVGVFLTHLVILSVVWVGFSVPFPRPQATFIYEGALPAGDTANTSNDIWQQWKMSDQFALDHFRPSYFNHWIQLREPSK